MGNVANGVRKLLAERAAELERRAADDATFATRMADFVNAVRSGEQTTGDPIGDFVLVTQGTLGKVAEAPYRALAAQLVGKSGELFLVVARSVEERTGFGNTTTMSLTAERFVGVLVGDQLQVNLQRGKGFVGLPAAAHVRVATTLASRWPEGVKQGTFWLVPFAFAPLEKKDVVVGGELNGAGPQLEIIVGTDSVLGSCAAQVDSPDVAVEQHILLRRAIRRLGVEVSLSEVEEAFQRATRDAALAQLEGLAKEGIKSNARLAEELIAVLCENGADDNPLVISYARILADNEDPAALLRKALLRGADASGDCE